MYLLSPFLLLLAATSVVSIPGQKPSKGYKGLNDYAKEIGKDYFGTAADIPGPELQDSAYLAVLDNTHEFGQLTPTNYMKYFATEPSRNVFNYTGGNYIINIGAANHQLVRCHNLIWHSQLPDWLVNGTWDNKTLSSILVNHVMHLVKHWGSHCYAWDVVNEALFDNGTYRTSIWYDTIGPSYIPLAFSAAAKAARGTRTKLYYNDYNIEYPGPKSAAAQGIVKSIQAYGARIDGVGLQAHFVVGDTPSYADQKANMEAFTKLGVVVAQTELDVRLELPTNSSNLAQQKRDYYDSVKACVDVKGCVGTTVWDFDDKYSWIPAVFTGEGAADLWDENPKKKPAYYGVQEALKSGLRR